MRQVTAPRKVPSPYAVLSAKNPGKPEEAERKHMETGPLPRLWKSPEGTLTSLALLSLVSADMVMEGAPNMRVKEKKGIRRINKPLSSFDFPRHSYACAFCFTFLAFIPPIHYLQL